VFAAPLVPGIRDSVPPRSRDPRDRRLTTPSTAF
jgi:hypothetical protein